MLLSTLFVFIETTAWCSKFDSLVEEEMCQTFGPQCSNDQYLFRILGYRNNVKEPIFQQILIWEKSVLNLITTFSVKSYWVSWSFLLTKTKSHKKVFYPKFDHHVHILKRFLFVKSSTDLKYFW